MDFDQQRSQVARDLAERALIELALHLGDHASKVVVIGGLNPEYLTDPPVDHLGTTDVDILLEVGLIYDRDELDFSWLEQALFAAGFTNVTGGWRWRKDILGVPVKLEILCDAPDNLGLEIALPGASVVGAMNLQGPAPALEDAYFRDLEVPADLETGVASHPSTVRVRFAGLGGYILAKAAALTRRLLDKDAYDLVFVLLFNDAGGPRAAAAAARRAVPSGAEHDCVLEVRAIRSHFASPDAQAARDYALQMVRAGDPSTADQLAQDAVSAVAAFVNEFEALVRNG